MASIILESLFFERMGPVGIVTCTVNGKRHESFLQSQFIPSFQQRACLIESDGRWHSSMYFKARGATPQNAF